MNTEFETGIAQNGTHYAEAAPGTFAIGDTFTTEFRIEAKPITKKMIRCGIEGHPAGTVTRTFTVKGMGKEFTVGDPMKDEKMQRFYCDVEEVTTYDEV